MERTPPSVTMLRLCPGPLPLLRSAQGHWQTLLSASERCRRDTAKSLCSHTGPCPSPVPDGEDAVVPLPDPVNPTSPLDPHPCSPPCFFSLFLSKLHNRLWLVLHAKPNRKAGTCGTSLACAPPAREGQSPSQGLGGSPFLPCPRLQTVTDSPT